MHPRREGTDWLEKILERILTATAARRPELLLDVCDNISPGLNWPPPDHDLPAGPVRGFRPSSPAVVRFRDEFEAYIAKAEPPPSPPWAAPVPVDIRVGPSSSDTQPPTETSVPSPSTVRPSRPRRASSSSSRRAQRRLHPALLLPPAMKPVGMCRMCIVDIDSGRGPALQPLHDRGRPDMVVDTESDGAPRRPRTGSSSSSS